MKGPEECLSKQYPILINQLFVKPAIFRVAFTGYQNDGPKEESVCVVQGRY